MMKLCPDVFPKYMGQPGPQLSPLSDVNGPSSNRNSAVCAESVTPSTERGELHHGTLGGTDVPLRYTTPPRWAKQVSGQPTDLLNDHAHLEKKAAVNALELIQRRPHHLGAELAANWVAKLTTIAREEVDHLAIVTRVLAKCGGSLSN